jgi:hypothetical protein
MSKKQHRAWQPPARLYLQEPNSRICDFVANSCEAASICAVLQERLELQRRAEAEFARERAMVDEVVARIQAEDRMELQARRCKQAETKVCAVQLWARQALTCGELGFEIGGAILYMKRCATDALQEALGSHACLILCSAHAA